MVHGLFIGFLLLRRGWSGRRLPSGKNERDLTVVGIDLLPVDVLRAPGTIPEML
jgi:hypothetical protein